MVKTLLLGLLTFTLFNAAAAEIYFVPGWFSKWKNFSGAITTLQQIYPQSDVHVCKWENNKSWDKAKAESSVFAGILASEIISKNNADVILIGHSLGGRIILECAAELARHGRQVEQIILLGTAAAVNDEDIKNCQTVSRQPVINIFCVDDNLMKLFLFSEKQYPLGLAGLPQKTEHFQQYRMYIKKTHLKLFDVLLIDMEISEPLLETINHLSSAYLKRLLEISSGNEKECCYDLESMENTAAARSIKADSIPGFSKLDEYDSWLLEERQIKHRFRITSPSGRKFHYSSRADAYETFSCIKAMLKAM